MVEIPNGRRLVLASASPRRRALLAGAGFEFEVRPADIDETPLAGESPAAYVRRLSVEKSAAVLRPDELVIAADTTVELDGAILEKPVDDDDAARMLRLLSGRSHHAHTGVTVVGPDALETTVVSTVVTFVDLTDHMVRWYLATGEANDKAGAYGIQGAAAAFVERIDGSVTNVIGLPLAETVQMVRRSSVTG